MLCTSLIVSRRSTEYRREVTYSPMTFFYDAILRNLQTLSEATQQLPEYLKQQYDQIPWAQISGFRNILVHNYLGDIDPETILSVVKTHIPPLQRAAAEMIKQSNEPGY